MSDPGWMQRSWVRIFLACCFLGLARQGDAQPGPGQALEFDGVDSYVEIPHSFDLNAFPLTITAWVRTTQNEPGYQGIVTKTTEGSNTGYALALSEGRVHGWYYLNAFNRVWVGEAGSAGAFVADGIWHHLAFIVTPSVASLYVDGQLSSARNWVGTSGRLSDAHRTPVALGRYFGPTKHFFRGRLDEVTLWDRELVPDELNHLRHRHLLMPLIGAAGLVAYYPFDDGAEPRVSDVTEHGHDGGFAGLTAPVVWPSTAPVNLSPVAQTALAFPGQGAWLGVQHDAALNAYPLTLTAWMRTAEVSPRAQGIVSKYADASLNGYSMFVYNGRLRAWFFRDGLNYVWNPASLGGDGLGVDGGFVADGAWHHVAFTVGAAGGRLYVDGFLRGTLSWSPTTFAKGRPTSEEPLQFGLYWSVPRYAPFQGNIDEIALYQTELTAAQIVARRNTQLTGGEANLVGYWKCDEGATDAGSRSVEDSSGDGHVALWVGEPSWVGSTAHLGDGQVHLSVDYTPAYGRLHAISSGSSAKDSFSLRLQIQTWRVSDYGHSLAAPAPSSTLSLEGDTQIRDATSGRLVSVDPEVGHWSTQATLAADYLPLPLSSSGFRNLALEPRLKPLEQLDSVDNYYTFGTSVAYGSDAPPAISLPVFELPITQVFHFNGKLFFSDIESRFSDYLNVPSRGAPLSGGVQTEVSVPLNNGFLPASAAHRYGNGTPIKVILYANGDCLGWGSVVGVTGPVPDEDQVGNIYFERQGIKLGDGGATSFIRLELPAGFSVGLDPTNRVTTPFLEHFNVRLDGQLKPAEPVLRTRGPLYGVSDSHPVWFRAEELQWVVGAWQIVLPGVRKVAMVRQLEDEVLQALLDQGLVANAREAERKSNDGYLRFATIEPQDVIVGAASDGAARLSADLLIDRGFFRPHFPLVAEGDPIRWDVPSLVRISESLTDVSASQLQGVHPFDVPYRQTCSNDLCASGVEQAPKLVRFTPAADLLSFTVDGGLTGAGSVIEQNLAWGLIAPGQFAQQAGKFVAADFAMSGYSLRRDQSTREPSDRPAVLLLTGAGRDGEIGYLERPYEAAYAAGFANYPGLNFRASADGARQGVSVLGGSTVGPFPLRGRSKYYVRYGGVSGIHEAQQLSTGKIKFYGYDLTIDGLLLSYLDSENLESRTDGNVNLPNPAGFTQSFEKLKFLCRGDLDSATIPPRGPERSLTYWPAKIIPQTMVFQGDPAKPCGTTPRLLVLGSDIKAANIPQTLHGLLGFFPDGRLSTVDRNRGSGIDSRFKPSALISFRGPGGSSYRLSTSGEAYFNHPAAGADVGVRAGFLNVVGRTDLPFFEDMWSHLHLKNDGPTGVDVMGGWDEGGKSTLTTDKLDRGHQGFPGTDLTAYRVGQVYQPHARKQWLGIVDFDYPLKWSPTLGTFTSAEETTKELLVLEVKNRIKRMTPTMADLDFGIEAGIPKISLSKFAHDAVEGLTGAEAALKSALTEAASTQLSKGVNSLNRVMSDQVNALFEAALRDGVNVPLAGLHTDLVNAYNTSRTKPAEFTTAVKNSVKTRLSAAQLQQVLLGGAGANEAFTVVRQVQNALSDVSGALRTMEDLLSSAGRDQRFKQLISALIGSEAPGFVSQLGAGLAKQAFTVLLQDVQPSLDTLAGEVRTLRSRFDDVRTQLGSGGFAEVNLGLSVELQKAVDALADDVASSLTPADLADGRYFAEHPQDQVVDQLRRRLTDAVLGSGVAKLYQTALRERLYDLQARMRTAMDGVFQTANQLALEALSSVLSGADQAFDDFLGSNLKDIMAAAKLDGHAHIVDDSLKELSLDADLRLKIPDDFGFHGFLRIRELSSDNTPVGCLSGYDKATEVVMGAKDVNLEWLAPKLKANLDGKFIFKAQNGTFEPVGMGGGVGITGKMKFEVFELNELAAALAFGQEENFLAGRVRAKVNRYEFATGFFFGRTCFIDPLLVADRDVGKTLSTRPENFPFAGAYLYGEAWVPLNEALGIVSTCAFNIRGGQGVGSFVFIDGQKHLNVGGKYLYGISGELLCILGVQGEIRAVGGIVFESDPLLVLRGVGKVSAELGYCPFCLSWSKEVGMTIRAKSSTVIRGAIGAATNPIGAIDTLGEAEYEFDY